MDLQPPVARARITLVAPHRAKPSEQILTGRQTGAAVRAQGSACPPFFLAVGENISAPTECEDDRTGRHSAEETAALHRWGKGLVRVVIHTCLRSIVRANPTAVTWLPLGLGRRVHPQRSGRGRAALRLHGSTHGC